jgi:hypothetical protein
MKQNCLLLLCFAFSIFRIHAQTVTMTLSNKFSLRDRGLTQKEGASFLLGSNFYCVETDYKGMQLAYIAKLDKVKYDVNVFKFDDSMKLVNKITLDGQWRLGPFPPEKIVFGGKLLVFYYRLQDNGSISLLFSVVDPETLGVTPGKELYVLSEKNVGIFKLAEVFKANRLALAVSPDSSKLLVVQSGNTGEVCTAVLNKDLSFAKPFISKVKGDLEGFSIGYACIDVAGNKYLIYDYLEDKRYKHGVIVQNTNGKEAYMIFRQMQDVLEPGLTWVKPSRDNTKVYVYGIVRGERLEEGVFLATVDAQKLRLSNPQVFSYPQDLREKLHQLDYAEKNHGSLGVKNAFYMCNELDDGTLALTGYPEAINTSHHMPMTNMDGAGTDVIEVYAGPIINIFIKNGKAGFGVIYRSQAMSNASMVIPIPFHDKLVCIYNDNEKSIASDDLHVNGKKYEMRDLVLACAVIGSDGTVISRKKLADKAGHLSYFTNDREWVSPTRCLVPLGKDRYNMVRYYTEYEQWVTINVN